MNAPVSDVPLVEIEIPAGLDVTVPCPDFVTVSV